MNKIKASLAAIGLVVFSSQAMASQITLTAELENNWGRVLPGYPYAPWVQITTPWIIDIVIKDTDVLASIPRDVPKLPYWKVPVELYVTQLELGLDKELVYNWDEVKIERNNITVFGTKAYEFMTFFSFDNSTPAIDISKTLFENSSVLDGYTHFIASADNFPLTDNGSGSAQWGSGIQTHLNATTITIAAVPEPSTYAMLGLGLGLGLLGVATRRRKSA